MKFYQTHNFMAVCFVAGFAGFLGVIMYSSNPQESGATPTQETFLQRSEAQFLLDDARIGDADYSVDRVNPEWFATEMNVNPDQDLIADSLPIEINSDDSGSSAAFASLVEVRPESNVATNPSNYSSFSSSTDSAGASGSGGQDYSGVAGGSSGAGTVSGSSGSGGSGGSGTSTGRSIFHDSEEPTDMEPGTGEGSSTVRQIDPDDLLCFALQRNGSHFRLYEDPILGNYFAPNFVWDIRLFNDQDDFLRMTALLRKQNPGTILGSYTSACLTMMAKDDTFPPSKLPLEECNPDWLLRDADGKTVTYGSSDDRYYLDMRRAEVRTAIISRSVARAKLNGLDSLCFDNCYWGISLGAAFPATAAEWTDAFMNFYQEAGQAAHDADLKCVVNMATTADKIADAFRAVAPYVDGLMSEMAFHPKMRSPESLERELQGYEDVLKLGKIVLLIPRYKEDERFALTTIQPLALQYRNIYVTAGGPVHHESLYYLPHPPVPE